MIEGTVVAKRFAIEQAMGAGGVGRVYRAHDRLTDRPVALKVLLRSTEDAGRFAREASALSQLDHPNVARFIAHGALASGEPYLVMEWVEGESLGERLRRGVLGVEETIRLATGVARALGAAHAKQIVHRDVKPGNVMLRGGRIEDCVLVDFGLAKDKTEIDLTRPGMAVGTPSYMSPEQARGESVDSRTDVFALACVIYKCLTGATPFGSGDPMAVLARIALEPAPRLCTLTHGVPEALDDLTQRMLAKERTERPADGGLVASELVTITVEDHEAPRLSLPLSEAEQRVVSVVVTRAAPGDEVTLAPDASVWERTREIVLSTGGSVAVLANGALVVTMSSPSAADQAVAAVRCAVGLRSLFPDAPIGVATGRGLLGGRYPIGQAIERAVALLAEGTGGIRIDDVTSSLVEGRLDLRDIGARDELVSAFVGRDAEVAIAVAQWDRCREERTATAILVLGDAGVGKSRLVSETLARITPPAVWRARGELVRAGHPFDLVGQLVRSAARLRGDESLERSREALVARVARSIAPDSVARVAAFLGEAAGIPFDTALVRAVRSDPVLMSDQITAAWREFVMAEGRESPLVLALDDAHWGDGPSLRLVGDLIDRSDLPLLLLVAARPELRSVFPALWTNVPSTEIHLGGIVRSAAATLVRRAAGELEPDRVEQLVTLAGGNPFFLLQLSRSAAEGRSSLPETVLAIVQNRLAGIDPEARRVLRAASILGETFWLDGVAAMLDEGAAARAPRWMDALQELGWVVRQRTRRSSGQPDLRFRHALVQQAAYETLTDEDRRAGHRAAAKWLEAVKESNAFVLAEHYARGERPDRAIDYLLDGAANAVAKASFDEASRATARARELGASGDRLGRAFAIEALVCRWRFDWAGAMRNADSALALLPPDSSDWADAALIVGTVSGLLDYPNFERLRDDVCDVLAKAEPTVALVRAGLVFIGGSVLAERYDGLERLFEWVETIREHPVLQDPTIRPRYCEEMALVKAMHGDLAGAIALTEEGLPFIRTFDERWWCAQKAMLARYLSFAGRAGEAEQVLAGVDAHADAIGAKYAAAGVRKERMIARMLHGDDQRDAYEKVTAELQAIGTKRVLLQCRTQWALHALLSNDVEAAAKTVAAMDVTDAPPSPHAAALGIRSLVATALGRDDALALAKAAHRPLDEGRPILFFEAMVRLALCEALFATGDERGGRAALERAVRRLLERAPAAPRERAAFLRSVGENARTLALAVRHGITVDA